MNIKQNPDQRDFKIAVMDSGIGGLTVVRELQRQLPYEGIVYFGDNRNCPYGNKQPQELISLASGVISTLCELHPVKLTAVACNTTSSLLEQISPSFSIPLFSIIEPVAKDLSAMGMGSVGVLATVFTIKSGSYQKQIHRFNSSISVTDESSPSLAALIDSGKLDSPQLADEVRMRMANLTDKGALDAVILGCTHYPIIADLFHRLYPDTIFLDPAVQMVSKIKSYLEDSGLGSKSRCPTFDIYTTGEPQLYRDMCQRLGIRNPDTVTVL